MISHIYLIIIYLGGILKPYISCVGRKLNIRLCSSCPRPCLRHLRPSHKSTSCIAYAFTYAAFFCAHLVSVPLLAKILARRDFDKMVRGTCEMEAALRHLQPGTELKWLNRLE